MVNQHCVAFSSFQYDSTKLSCFIRINEENFTTFTGKSSGDALMIVSNAYEALIQSV